MLRLTKLAVVTSAALFGVVVSAPSQVNAFWGGYNTVSDDFASCLHGKGCGYFEQSSEVWELCTLDFNRNPECGFNLVYLEPYPEGGTNWEVYYWLYCADFEDCGWSWVDPLVPAPCGKGS